jgi:hypothetical protein
VQFRCINPKELQLTGATGNGSADLGVLTDVAVSSNVPNADVSVDGKFVGNAPLTSLKLAPGVHAFEVTAKGYLPWKRELTVIRASATRVMAQLDEAPKP